MTNTKNDISKWYWLGIPAFIFIVPFIVRIIDGDLYESLIHGELGLFEIATVIFLAIAIIVGLILFLKKEFDLKFRLWILFVVTACIYFLGEEISWGQHYINWTTPDIFERHGLLDNRQHETNFHNNRNESLRMIFEDIPKLGIKITIAVIGFLGPILHSVLKLNKTNVLYWFLGTIVCLPAGILAFTITFPERIIFKEAYERADRLKLPKKQYPRVHSNESKECIFALFLMLYVGSIYRRSKKT